MLKQDDKILKFKSLKIGYVSGRHKSVLLPPLNAGARCGELIAVIGRNGIGKSTLLRTLIGLQPALGGEILYNGERINYFSRMDLAQITGYISTEIVKVSNMTVYDLVALGRYPHTNWTGKIEAVDHEVIMDAIEKTSMSAFCKRFVSELSDGERQKAMIARILAQDTPVMVMDEPTAFLDIGSKYEILHLLHTLSRKGDKTIIFSTHDLQMAISKADKIWLILDDKLIEGSPEDLMLQGAFEHLFESSSVWFNSDQATFDFMSENTGSIYLEGNGTKRHYTEKALKRTGYSVSDSKTIPYIIVPSDKDSKWNLVSENNSHEASSIYELLNLLAGE